MIKAKINGKEQSFNSIDEMREEALKQLVKSNGSFSISYEFVKEQPAKGDKVIDSSLMDAFTANLLDVNKLNQEKIDEAYLKMKKYLNESNELIDSETASDLIGDILPGLNKRMAVADKELYKLEQEYHEKARKWEDEFDNCNDYRDYLIELEEGIFNQRRKRNLAKKNEGGCECGKNCKCKSKDPFDELYWFL